MRYLLVMAVLLLCSGDVSAQAVMMMGRIVDEQNKPIPGAIIKIGKDGSGMDIVTDENGLYNSTLIPSGAYRIDISANNQYYRAKKVYVAPAKEIKRYYNFKLKEGKVIVNIDERNPFLTARLDKIRDDDEAVLFDGRKSRIFVQDSTKGIDKMVPLYGTITFPPRTNGK